MGIQQNSFVINQMDEIKDCLKTKGIIQKDLIILQKFGKSWLQIILKSNQWKTLESRNISKIFHPLKEYRIIKINLICYDTQYSNITQFSSKGKIKDKDYIQVQANGQIIKIGFEINSVLYPIFTNTDSITIINGFYSTSASSIQNNELLTHPVNSGNFTTLSLTELTKMTIQERI